MRLTRPPTDAAWLLSISGEPGIGKSHLAGRGTAPRPRPRFPDVALLQRAASDHPLAILVDDIHWADPASLDLPAYLALSLADHDCLIVATDRGDPGRIGAPVPRAAAACETRGRHPPGTVAPDEVADLVAGNLGGEPPAPLLEMLGRRAHGMALYVTSLVASLRSQGRLFDNGGLCVLGSGPDAGLPTGHDSNSATEEPDCTCRPGYPLVTFRSKRGEAGRNTEAGDARLSCSSHWWADRAGRRWE